MTDTVPQGVELDATTPWVRWWLRAEGLAGFALGAFVWFSVRGDWPVFVVALLLPDISMAGYLGGPHLGAIAYNVAHNWFVGGLLLGLGLWFGSDSLAMIGAALVAHTGIDRVMGYGLKYPTGFADTHLGRIGRRDRPVAEPGGAALARSLHDSAQLLAAAHPRSEVGLMAAPKILATPETFATAEVIPVAVVIPVAKGPPLPGEIAARIGPDLPATFALAAERTPDRIALVERRTRTAALRRTYREVQERSGRVALRLIADGVRPGDRIALCAPNRVAVVELLLGAWRAGAAVVPFDLRMAPDTIEKIIASAGPVAVYLDPSVDPAPFRAAPIRALDDTLGDQPADGDATSGNPAPAGGLASGALPAIDAESLAEILFTSGTTGTPKGVMLTHRAMVAASASVASLIAPVAHRGLGIVPLSHMYGQMAPLVAGWIRGSTLVFPTSVSPREIVDALKAERITAITIVPAVADLLRSKIEREAAALGSAARLARAQRIARRLPWAIRRRLFRSVLAGLGGELALLTSGGARLDPATADFFEAMGILVMEGYGSTEMAAIAGHTHGHRPHGTAGRLMPGVEIAFGPDGELLSRGPAMASGYWGRPDLTAEVFAGGWAHSGDAASLDASGNLVVNGRTRDRITLASGLKVYPGELEELLRRDPGVTEAVVLLDGDRLTGFVTGEEALDFRDLRDRVNGQVAVSHRLSAVRRYPDPDFPRTHTLKVRRSEVAARIATAARIASAAQAAGAEVRD